MLLRPSLDPTLLPCIALRLVLHLRPRYSRPLSMAPQRWLVCNTRHRPHLPLTCTHTLPWGPALAPRQGSSPLTMSNLGPGAASLHARTSHQHQPSAQIKPAMPGSERSPIVQRAHPSGSSTPSNIAAHSSPSTKPLLTASGTLILDIRTADEQKARLATARPKLKLKPNLRLPMRSMMPRGRDRDKDWDRERQLEDVEFRRHPVRERGLGGKFLRLTIATALRHTCIECPRLLVHPLLRVLILCPLVHLDRHNRHLRAPASAWACVHLLHVIACPHPAHERDRMPPLPHERQPHDRLQPPPAHPHPHRPGPPLLPGQGQFQTQPPDWDAARERDRDIAVAREREREMARERDMPMGVGSLPRDYDLARSLDKDLERDLARSGCERDLRDPGVLLPPREREMFGPREPEVMAQRERDLVVQRERERDMIPAGDRERMSREMEQRENTAREMEGMSVAQQRDREIREREIHVQRERERWQREGEMALGCLPAFTNARGKETENAAHIRACPPPTALASTSVAPAYHRFPAQVPVGQEARGNIIRLHIHMTLPANVNRRSCTNVTVSSPGNTRWSVGTARESPSQSATASVWPFRSGIAWRFRREITSCSSGTVRSLSGIGCPLERSRMAERERANLERDRAMRERERERALPPEQRDRALLERERSMFERERLPSDRERLGVMESHRLDMLERERMEAFERDRERERVEMMERDRDRDRDREREMGVASAGVSARDRERERDRDRMIIDVPLGERERDERLVGPGSVADREAMERQREQERLELMERERGDLMEREREHPNPAHLEGERTDVERERERLEAVEREHERDRERFEMLERERVELLERERLGGLDAMERERLEMVERERFEILEHERLEMLERERLEMLDRMPNAAELARARKERERKPFVSLGTYVWPRTPFPYYFPEWISAPVVASENKTTEAGPSTSSSAASTLPQPAPTSPVPTELRLSVLIPPSFLPPARPSKFRLWGGGLPPPPPFPPAPSTALFSRRRVYTDDSDVIQCAVHAGLLTWSGVARAKSEGRTVRVVLALVPTLASASGATRGEPGESRAGTNGVNGVNGNANGHVNGTTSLPRTRTSTPLPPLPISAVPSTSSSASEPQPPAYAGGIWANRFIGGWGEAFYGEPGAGRGENTGHMTGFEEAEDDGRGCVSCGWGWGHDGSAFEVISVVVVEVSRSRHPLPIYTVADPRTQQHAHVAPGLGFRNRTQRLAEYAQRRADILGLPPAPSSPLLDVTNTRKRRRLNVDFADMKRAGASEVALIAHEARKMAAMTISFGVAVQRKSGTGVGFKYDPQIVQCVLFPHLHQTSIVDPPPCKRRKLRVTQERQGSGEVEIDCDDPECGVVLESTKETYLITRAAGKGQRRYTLLMFGPPGRADGPPSSGPSASDPKPSQPPPPTLSTSSAIDPSLDTSNTSLPEPLEETPKSSTASSRAVTEAPKPDNPPDPNAGKGKEDNQPTASPIPPSIPSPPLPTKPTTRVLLSDLTDTSFIFKDDIIVVKKVEQTNDKLGDEGVAMDEDHLTLRVLRWRWYSEV
ncbi:hypothetical protein BU15DRAFT_66565 [Melanogaster broomeanus]|nr:hypothetical protein BU15DRAFT_66565 [Melanogaster broomeanus]